MGLHFAVVMEPMGHLAPVALVFHRNWQGIAAQSILQRDYVTVAYLVILVVGKVTASAVMI